jgi:UDP-N-acetylglucosamine transferase subunit ALG13
MPGVVKLFSTGQVLGEIVLIFLTIGTWCKGFDRLVKAVDELVECDVITDKVIAQIGYSSYTPKHLNTIRFCSPDDFADLVSSARLLISHAGIGTIIHAIAQCKPIVVVPRRKELGEVDNEHQFATAKQFAAEGSILVAYDVSELATTLKQAETFVPVGSKGSEKILQAVQGFIDKIAAKKT